MFPLILMVLNRDFTRRSIILVLGGNILNRDLSYEFRCPPYFREILKSEKSNNPMIPDSPAPKTPNYPAPLPPSPPKQKNFRIRAI